MTVKKAAKARRSRRGAVQGLVSVSRDRRSRASRARRGPRVARTSVEGAPRTRVMEVQRARILTAMVRVVSEDGVGAATVSRVVKRAGVSRRTFYEHFSGCEDCFLAVFEEALARASRSATSTAVTAPPAWRERVRAG